MEKALIIIPTYNEIENIESIIKAVFDTRIELDILVVDDQSPDGTAMVVKNLMKDFPNRLHLESRENKQGLGAAYVHGFHWALNRKYAYIFEMDADFSHSPDELQPMIELLKTKADVVV
ncbi:MAG: glycosyltransferase, partial [Flavobacteriaceae bacterium]